MRPQFFNICAVVVVHLVAVPFHLVTVGAHDVSPNVITKSASALQLSQGTRHLRTHRSTQDGEEERGYEIATDFGLLVKNIKSALLPGKVLEGSSIDTLKHIAEKWLFADKDMGVENYEKEVDVNSVNAYVANLEKYSNIDSTVVEPSHLTLAEPILARSNDKGPAEIAGVQLTPKETSDQDQYAVWLQHGVHPTDVLELLKLGEAGETFLGDLRMFLWIHYVNLFNEMHPKNPTTVIDALKKWGIEEETLVNMVFSWDLRRESIVEQVEEYMHFPSDKSRKKMEKTLLKSQEKGLGKLQDQAKGKSPKNLASMLAQWIETKKEDIEAASTSSTQKRKRDT
ncbi:hypothetical protein DD237_000928 [Peronospora effusa]|uniref:RxLR effector protein n=1 Tax=Peronospora effusa TaxID=542832 RepID=A0A3R7WV12_9STRA|nr:hypothetical protein DD237_000928 [Peronospora effusa]